MASESMSKSVLFLTVFVVLNTVALVIVTLVQCNNIRDLETSDGDLENAINDLIDTADPADTTEEKDTLRRAIRNLLTPPSDKRAKRSGMGDIFMDLLKAQENVIEQQCKDTNKICKQGDKGDTGPVGDKGPKGAQGSKGVKGVQGLQGPQGPKGVTGPVGNPGIKGTAGIPGPAGIQGPVGDKGDTGIKGIIGAKGERGMAGMKGEKGETGHPGIPGKAGVKGAQGTKGPKGERGAPGVKGSKGEPGQRGADRDKLQVGCECLKAPTIAGPESEVQHVPFGGTATLHCNADGVPPPNITWSGSVKVNGPVVNIPRVTSFDYTTYQCTATNVFGSDTKNITVVQ